MRLLEYEAKNMLAKSGVPVPPGVIIKPDKLIVGDIPYSCVLKSQVPVGGRGKAGGVVVVKDCHSLNEAIERLFVLDIKGFVPSVLLAEPLLDIAREYYLSLGIDREAGAIQLMVNADGGMEVESQRDGFRTWNIAHEEHDFSELSEATAELFGLHGALAHKLKDLFENLHDCFISNDATLLEINPLVLTTGGELVCADAKIELDDAARFRHADWQFEDTLKDVNFVTLDSAGTVGTIANGAGLAMATVDAVAAAGMRPANFLDVGGGANKEGILISFNRMVEYRNVTAIVINIFAGITRCDEVARAIIAAKEEIPQLPRLFIRLSGTNFEEAKQLLDAAHIPLMPTLEECLVAAKEATT